MLPYVTIALEVIAGSMIGLSFVVGGVMLWERRTNTGRPLERSIDKALTWRDRDRVEYGGSDDLVADQRFAEFDRQIDDDYAA